MAHKTDVPKNFEIWGGGPNGLRLRKHPRLQEALKYLDEYPMVIRKTTVIDSTALPSDAEPVLRLGSIPAFRRSSVGETVELRLELDCPALRTQGPVQFARVFFETADTLLEEHVVVKPGKRQFLTVPFPAFDHVTEFTVSMELRDQPQLGIFTKKATLQPEKRLTFYYAFQTHLDLGWTDRVAPTIESLKKMTSEVAIKVCKEYMDRPQGERFVWTCECSDALRLAWEGATTSQQEDLREFIRLGLIQCCAFPFSFHTGIMSKDLLHRSIERSYSLRDKIGVEELDLSVAQSNDVPGHSWIVPDVLAEKGINRAVIGHNTMVRGCKLPPLFNWQGPSGKQVLTLATTCVDYGSSFPVPQQATDLYGLSCNNEDGANLPGTAIFRTIGYGENCGPEGAEREMNAIRNWNETFAWPKLVIGAPKDYFEHIEKEINRNELPVVSEEISDWWIDGPASMPTAMGQYRQAMLELPRLASVVPEHVAADRKTLESIEENLILHAEHTFGMNAQLVRPTASSQNWELGNMDDYTGSWTDKEIYATEATYGINKLRAKYPVERIDDRRRHENWHIEWDDNGITRLTSPSGRCWYDRKQIEAAPSFLELSQHLLPTELDEWFHHNPIAAPNAGSYAAQTTSITNHNENGINGVKITGRLQSPSGAIESTCITIGNTEDSSDLVITVDLKGKQPTAQSEYLTLALPFTTEAPIYRTDVGEALLTVDQNQRPDANRDEHPVITGWTVANGNAGHELAISSPEVFLWHFGDLRYCNWNRKSPSTRSATAYAHLMNNVWNTNFRCWNEGDFQFTIRIRDISGNDALPELQAMAELWVIATE